MHHSFSLTFRQHRFNRKLLIFASLNMQSRFLYLLFKLGQVEESGGNSSDVTFLEDTISCPISSSVTVAWISRKDSQKHLGRVAPHASHSLLPAGLTRVHLVHAVPSLPDILRQDTEALSWARAGSTLLVSATGWKSLDLLHISQMLELCLLW